MSIAIKKTQQTVINASNMYLDLANELYRAFDFFNTYFMKGELKKPIITIASNNRKKALGWFGGNFWALNHKKTRDDVSEINMCAEHLQRPMEDVLETLLHEMAHLYNFQHGLNDCNNQQRHNRKFKEAAEKFGLNVTKSKRYGFAHTSLNETGKKAIKLLKPNKEVYSAVCRKTFSGNKNTSGNKLKPLMVDPSIKGLVETMAEEYLVNQKVFTETAIKCYVHLLSTNKVPPGFELINE